MRWGLQMLHFIFSFAVIAAIRYVQFYNPRFAIHDLVILFLESTFKVDQTLAAMMESGTQELLCAYLNQISHDKPTLDDFEKYLKMWKFKLPFTL